MNKRKYMCRYIAFLRRHFSVPNIRTQILWHAPALTTDDVEYEFGLFLWPREGEDGKTEIYVAGKKIRKSGIMSVLAHEYAHCRQMLDGQNMEAPHIECEAELMGQRAMGEWFLQKEE